MIISRTPFRISFFGGGTDLPAWFEREEGVVLSTTIDKYCYISCRKLPSFFEHKHRFVYSKQELVDKIDDIDHPSIRETFRFLNIQTGVEIQHASDLPARSGIGSSSSFTVGLLNSLYGLKGQMVSKEQLYRDAIHIEQNMIKESVGSQDQVAAAVGGLNIIRFYQDRINVSPFFLNKDFLDEFKNRFMLFFTGISRMSGEIESEKIAQMYKKVKHYALLKDLAEQGIHSLLNEDLVEFSKALKDSWAVKKELSDRVTNSTIDSIYHCGINNGAAGGKLLGSGGGGFILFFVDPDKKELLKEKLKDLMCIPFDFDIGGSKIIYYNGDRI